MENAQGNCSSCSQKSCLVILLNFSVAILNSLLKLCAFFPICILKIIGFIDSFQGFMNSVPVCSDCVLDGNTTYFTFRFKSVNILIIFRCKFFLWLATSSLLQYVTVEYSSPVLHVFFTQQGSRYSKSRVAAVKQYVNAHSYKKIGLVV